MSEEQKVASENKKRDRIKKSRLGKRRMMEKQLDCIEKE